MNNCVVNEIDYFLLIRFAVFIESEEDLEKIFNMLQNVYIIRIRTKKTNVMVFTRNKNSGNQYTMGERN